MGSRWSPVTHSQAHVQFEYTQLSLGLTLASSRITNKLSDASKITNNLPKLL